MEVKLRVPFLQGVGQNILRVQHVRVDDGEVEEIPHEVFPPLLRHSVGG